jgi:hypothetical protein
MAAKSIDKILCGAASLIVLSSLGWSLSQGSKSGGHLGRPESGTNAAYVPATLGELQVNTPVWLPPAAQQAGAEWIYEVFTPPEIYYDAASNRFTVTAPNSKLPSLPVPEPAFGVELIQVKQDPFRLQLVGYTGKEGNYKGTFENTVSGKTVLGQAGNKVPDLELTIRSFEVKQNRTKQAKGMDIIETEAVAQVVDDKTGEVFNLTNKSRLTKGTPIAFLKLDGSAAPVPHRAGDTFTVGTATFKVLSVSFEPNEVVIVKDDPSLKQPLTKTLTPAAQAKVSASPAAPTPAAVPVRAPDFAL